MTVYRNKNYTKRDYEATNVVACIADEAPASPDNRWVEATPYVLTGLTQLWIENGVRFYGWL